MNRIAAPIFVLILFTACGTEEMIRPMDDSVRVSIDTVSGVERVTSFGELRPWDLVPILELGSVGGAGEPRADEFAWVSSVTVGPDGLLYIADLGNDHVVAFDSASTLRREIGRSGQGPGEFESLYSIAWLGDHLLALDLGNGRLGTFSQAGEWLDQQAAPGRLVASPVTYRLYPVGPGEVYQWAYQVVEGIPEPTWRRHDLEGSLEEWPRTIPVPESAFPDKVVCTMGRGFSWFDHPFATRTLGHPARGSRSLLATTDSYEVAVLGPSGDTVRVIQRDVEPPLLSDAEWVATTRRYSEWLEDKDPSRCEPRSLARPDRKPVIESLMVDVEGRIWVERNLTEGTVWEVFDASGRMVGALGGFGHDRQRTVPWLSDRQVAWVSRGELDSPRVHWARIDGSPER